MREFLYFPNRFIDEIDKSDDYYIPVWEDVISILESVPEIIDIGCGSGKFSSFLFQEYKTSLIGVDGNEYALEKAKLNGFEKTFIVNDFNKDQLPLKDQSYEFVF